MQDTIPQWVADYVGIPYLTHGRDRDGCDCWGLLNLVWREQFGFEPPKYEGADWYKGQRPAVIGTDAIEYASMFRQVEAGKEEAGDGIALRMRGYPFHVGIVVAPGLMLHTHEDAGVVVENYHSITWGKRISGFYRYEGK
jgi:lipoprotein Spr